MPFASLHTKCTVSAVDACRLLRCPHTARASLTRNVYYYDRQCLFSTRAIQEKAVRVIFFGSDQFSMACLDELVTYKKQAKDAFDVDLHVAVRKPKRAGRNLKQLREVPLAALARDYGLPLHAAEETEDFKNLQALGFDLAVAVSYGKLIPSSFIQSTTWGGINVHPSFLPRHSGPAPIQWAIYHNDPTTGVTIQTLHPYSFDKGQILMNSDPVRIYDTDSYETLLSRLCVAASTLLLDFFKDLVEKVHKPEDFWTAFKPVLERRYTYSHAPKIDPDMRRVRWQADTAERVDTAFRAFGGPLWTFARVVSQRKGQVEEQLRRVLLYGVSMHDRGDPGHTDQDLEEDVPPGFVKFENNDGSMIVQTVRGKVRVESAKIEGRQKKLKATDLVYPIFMSDKD
ncbi:formyl transferase [Lipomyces chichibuensis]|uniref:formyl transferase n=1 Tax=Lipomyces chichibuensis TaxID=1546026 RepID=UPI003342F422